VVVSEQGGGGPSFAAQVELALAQLLACLSSANMSSSDLVSIVVRRVSESAAFSEQREYSRVALGKIYQKLHMDKLGKDGCRPTVLFVKALARGDPAQMVCFEGTAAKLDAAAAGKAGADATLPMISVLAVGTLALTCALALVVQSRRVTV